MTATSPGSNFNQQGGSIFNQRRHYYAIQKPETPAWAKGTLIAALGYFISPVDAIPDVTPLIGYSDDLGVLTLALATVAAHITDDIKDKAQAKLVEWFGA